MATVQQNYSDTKQMLATRWYGKADIRSYILLALYRQIAAW